jgi:hypothetical protein
MSEIGYNKLIIPRQHLKEMKLSQNARDETTASRAGRNAVWIPHMQGASVSASAC